MNSPIVRGVHRATIRQPLRAGTYYRVCKGLYLTRTPHAHELLDVLLSHFPHACATGRTPAQLYRGQRAGQGGRQYSFRADDAAPDA